MTTQRRTHGRTQMRNKPHPLKFEPRKSKKRCTKSGKVKWYTQLDAQMAMANTNNKQGSNGRRNAYTKKEIRAYKCPDCEYWHTTSQPSYTQED